MSLAPKDNNNDKDLGKAVTKVKQIEDDVEPIAETKPVEEKMLDAVISNIRLEDFFDASMEKSRQPDNDDVYLKTIDTAEDNDVNYRRKFEGKIKRIYTCGVCQLTFRSITNLEKHLGYHYRGQKLECDLCSKKFVRQSNLNLHMLTHSGSKGILDSSLNTRAG